MLLWAVPLPVFWLTAVVAVMFAEMAEVPAIQADPLGVENKVGVDPLAQEL